ncbi:15337_t:CDS:2, partial [Racocetra persica]
VATQTAIVETGNTLDTLSRSLNKHVFAFPSGECASLGVSGIILGGISTGYGYLTQKFGMSSDNILDTQIVLANGTIVNHAKEYPDLFWALRDAGNAGYSSLNEAKPHIQELIELTKPKNESYVEWDWYHANIVDTAWKNFNHYKATSFYIDTPGLFYKGVEYLIKFIRNLKYQIFVRTALFGGGKVNEIERNETAFVHRNFMYFLGIGVTLDKDNYEICIEDLKSFSRVFQKHYTSFE